MHGFRGDRMLAGTALALILTISGYAAAAPQTPAEIEAAIPVPEAANVLPLTPAEIEATIPVPEAANVLPLTPADIEAAIPVPEPANVPPPTIANIETSAPTAVSSESASAPVSASQPNKSVDSSAAQLPQAETVNLKSLTGKDLIKAPIAASLTSADIPVAEKLRDILAGKADRFFSRKTERQEVEAFYRDRGFAPLWIDNGALSARTKAAIAYLRGVGDAGLDPTDYPAPELKTSEPVALAEAELKYTNTILAYARHAQTGRMHYSRVSADISYKLEYPEPAAILDKVADAKDLGAALASYNPPHPGYRALKAKLAELRQQKADTGPTPIEYGAALKYGKDKRGKEVLMKDPRVPQLRQRLGIADDPTDTVYDKPLADAVKTFQAKHQLATTGILNSSTIDALNGPRRDRLIDTIIANMERWRWLPRDLGKAYVMLNIPNFTLKVVNKEATVWTTRVVTGKPGRLATPLLTETMKYITVNPTWNVPPSIINNEYLPALQQDPDALNRIGLKVTQNADGTIRIYQPPGDGNALGRIRFNFPNKFLVYQHDTPDKNLFAHEKRAYSHGCMRVQNPDKYAEILLSISQPNEGYTAEHIRKMYGGAEKNINLVHPIPVHITYQTAFVDDDGRLQTREDIYGRDAATLAVLKGDTRKVADVPIERREVNEKPQVARLPVQSDNPFANFFQRQNDLRRQTERGSRGRVWGQQESGGFFDRLFR